MQGPAYFSHYFRYFSFFFNYIATVIGKRDFAILIYFPLFPMSRRVNLILRTVAGHPELNSIQSQQFLCLFNSYV